MKSTNTPTPDGSAPIATPRTTRLADALVDAIARYHRREIYMEDLVGFVRLTFSDASHIETELTAAIARADNAKKERDDLARWKKEMCIVLDNLDLQQIGQAMGLLVGDDVSKRVLPYIAAANERIAGLEKAFRGIQSIAEREDHYISPVASEMHRLACAALNASAPTDSQREGAT